MDKRVFCSCRLRLSSTKTTLSSSRLKWVLSIYKDLNQQAVTVFGEIFKKFFKKEFKRGRMRKKTHFWGVLRGNLG
ncbi:MAG: hypothetical protein IJL34_00135, partial [Treponema sp.]|nr:hypothetical protein [Treponema sp.]